MTGPRQPARPLIAAAWAGLVVLCLVGLFAATARALHVDHLGEHMVPIRYRILEAVGRQDRSNNAAEFARIDESFARYPAVTLLHVVPGGLFLLLAPLQLVRGIRRRFPAWHRWSGRALLVTGTVTALTGMFFGILMPFGGAGEALIIAIVGTLFLVAAFNAWRAIRRRDVTTHRRWMLRAFAVMLGVPLTRVIGTPIDIAFVGSGLAPGPVFVIDLWVAWAIAIGGAEWWIRRRRGATAERLAGAALSG